MANSKQVATWTPWRSLNLGVTGQSIKAAPGRVGGWKLCNNASSARFVKFYDTAGTPDQTSTPVFTIELPATSNDTMPLGDGAAEFVNGIAVRASTAVADNDTGAPSANDVVVAIFWS
jgi:hypothetical protein